MEISKQKLTMMRKLGTPKWRQEYRKFVVTGVRAIRELFDAKFSTDFIVVCRDELTAEGRALLKEVAGQEVFEVSVRNLKAIDESTTSQGILVVTNMPEPPDPAGLTESRRILLLDSISNPSNLGSILRSALAFGFRDVVVGDGSADVYSQKVIAASVGMQFRLNLHTKENLCGLVRKLKKAGIVIVGSGSEGSEIPASLPEHLCLVIGSEARGVSTDVIALCDMIVSIKMSLDCESLSAPVAAAILMKDLQVDSLGT